MSRAEPEGLAYLFRRRMTANVKRALVKMMAERDWTTAGHGWPGKETTLRLVGWSRQRRVVLRSLSSGRPKAGPVGRKLDRPLVLVDRTQPEQPLLGFAEVGPDREVGEYAGLVTSLDDAILTLGQLYRDRGDCENTFDELKNQGGLGRLYDAGPEALPTARRQRCADLQLVELVRPSGRSRPSTRGNHQPSLADAGDRPAHPACRASDADHHQHARRTPQSPASRPADRRLPGAIAANCGAVGPGAALASHPQPSPQALSEGPSTRPAAAPCSGLNSLYGCEEPQNPADDPRLTAGFRIIVSAGAYGSPQILMLSGIGPADDLTPLGIRPIVDLPVGANLQDHPLLSMCYLTDERSLFGAGSGDDVALYQQGRGPLTSNIGEGGGFLSTCGNERVPDCQFNMAPVLFLDEGLSAPVDHGFTITTNLLKPTSRGKVALRSARPDAKPRISHNYLATEHDRATMIASVRLAMDIFRRPVLSKVRRPPFAVPVSDAEADIVAFMPGKQVATITQRAPAPSAGSSTRLSGFSVPKDCVWPMRR